MNQRISQQLDSLRADGLLRRMRETRPGADGTVALPGSVLVNWGSNDYLGLSRHPAVVEAAIRALGEYGMGAGASRLITGTTPEHTRLEDALARFKGKQAALTFSSGYATAVGVLPAVAGKEDVIILDKLSHACLIDGAKLSKATLRVFPHNHLGKLESLLEWAVEHHPNRAIWVVTESIFSMDGDAAPLKEIVEIKKRYPFQLLVDEAHALGVHGPGGRGLAEALGVSDQIDLIMGTMSKSMGVAGGFVAGDQELIDLLINRARSLVFSTAPPPALAAAALASLEVLGGSEGDALRVKLWDGIRLLSEGTPDILKSPAWGTSAIFPVVLGDNRTVKAAAKFMSARGAFTPAIRYPTVPKDGARLRLSLTAGHEASQITQLIGSLRELGAVLAKRARTGDEWRSGQSTMSGNANYAEPDTDH